MRKIFSIFFQPIEKSNSTRKLKLETRMSDRKRADSLLSSRLHSHSFIDPISDLVFLFTHYFLGRLKGNFHSHLVLHHIKKEKIVLMFECQRNSQETDFHCHQKMK